jgi:DNA-directed RNA polymerase specialized sigma24 family protein
VLHFLDGYTQEEVAAQTGYSRRTIGKKLQQFEQRIRQLWQARASLKERR